MKTIDLRSDTVTQQTAEMRKAMFEAEVGDDVYGEDPTINRLEKMAAERMGKEAALFVVSGTMSNLVAILTHTRHGNEIILGDKSHIFLNEVGGAAALGGVMVRTLPNDGQGRLNPEEIEHAIRTRNIHYPETTLLCLENTHNFCGGAVLTAQYVADMCALAHRHGLKVHLDGARIFNAAVALGVPAASLVKDVDSVGFCLSKGLSAPVGSLLCGSKDIIERARKNRKMLGGGMRQAGVIAAAGIVALEETVPRLREDHANARLLAEGIAAIPGLWIDLSRVQTNIVNFSVVREGMSAPQLEALMVEEGVLFHALDNREMRMVTHRDVSREDIEYSLERLAGIMAASLTPGA